jgi:hypothetical protein
MCDGKERELILAWLKVNMAKDCTTYVGDIIDGQTGSKTNITISEVAYD